MKDLIEALTILAKYMPDDTYAPTHCEHDVLSVCGGIEDGTVSPKDAERLAKLGFHWGEDCWQSFRFGSC